MSTMLKFITILVITLALQAPAAFGLRKWSRRQANPLPEVLESTLWNNLHDLSFGQEAFEALAARTKAALHENPSTDQFVKIVTEHLREANNIIADEYGRFLQEYIKNYPSALSEYSERFEKSIDEQLKKYEVRNDRAESKYQLSNEEYKVLAEEVKEALSNYPSASESAKIITDYYRQNYGDYLRTLAIKYPTPIPFSQYQKELEKSFLEYSNARQHIIDGFINYINTKLAQIQRQEYKITSV